jgi:elongation factor Ts
MAQITAALVKQLRDQTGAGMMDCKAALTATDGDFEAAVDWLRTKGLAAAAKKAGRVASQGLVGVEASGRRGAVVEVNSETDFVARNPDFRSLAREIAMQIAAMDPKDVGELLDQAYIRDASKTVGELVTTFAATTGENVRVRRFTRFQLGESASEAA